MILSLNYILTDILTPLISAFIGGIFSLFIYRKGIKNSEINERKEKIELNYKKEKYFISSIESIMYFIDCQVLEISKLSKELKIDENYNLHLSLMAELELSDFKEISLKDMFDILVINRKGSFKEKSIHFTNLKNSLPNIEKIINSEKNKNEKFQKEIEEIIKSWNKNINELNNQYNLMIAERKLFDAESKLAKLLKPIIIDKQKEISLKNRSLSLIYQEIIKPTREVLENLQNDPFGKNNSFVKILEIITNCEQLLQLHNAYKKERRMGILKTGRNLILLKQVLNSSIDNLTIRKIK